MYTTQRMTARRAFLFRGAAALGAGAAAAVTGAAAQRLQTKEQQPEQVYAAETEAIRRLNREFLSSLEFGRFADAASMFADDARIDLGSVAATGRREIDALFTVQYAGQSAPVLHCSYRQCAWNPPDTVTLSDDGKRASAVFYLEVELARPFTGDSTIERMARLQGQMAERRWEMGRFEATYVRNKTQWQVATLDYKAI
jgi:hypothetical protein